MELWVSIGGEKKKYQGSFKNVMESLFTDGKGKEVKLFSVHAPKKELRRFKRELRKSRKDLIETARRIALWFYTRELRRANRCIKDYRKKTEPVSISKVKKARKLIEEIRPKIEALS
ncbi:hypothetical protein GWK41_04040 [Persephonella atlantica]|uniref:Transposase n=1 Tax=Persephonella atlantica TaxID=2699429 RepID=A0ABS1GHB2_9AQUI|nr:hypothetical protein [Persephonella atlantica]MBK3332235.1 hypothetical protein [Persephonella atlantica]